MSNHNSQHILRLHDSQVIQRTAHLDLYRVKYPSDILIKVPREYAGVSRALLNQTLSQINTMFSTNRYDPARICPTAVVDAITGTDIVKACNSPFFENGNVLQYISGRPDVDRLSLIRDLAQSIRHIHIKGRLFGNVHPNNVMVDSGGHAVLIDVEMPALARLYDGDRVYVPGMWAYKPPEQLRPPNGTGAGAGPAPLTTAMDVYSFATTSYAIFSGKPIPSGTPRNFAKICENGHDDLERPVGMRVDMWNVLRQCLDLDPNNRPTMTAVLESVDWS